MSIYQFAFHKNVKAEPPPSETFDLCRRLENGGELTRAEKDLLAQRCYGILGWDGAVYKLMGWAADFRPYLQEFIIEVGGGWQSTSYFAADKTALRRALSIRPTRIIEVQKRK